MVRDDALRCVTALAALHDSTGTYLNAWGHEPAPGSQAAEELDNFASPSRLTDAFVQGTLLLETAADQCCALVKVTTEPVQTMAPYTCARSALEAAALSVWILTGTITARTRVTRSLAFRYAGVEQQAKIVALRGSKADVEAARAKLDRTERLGSELGIERVVNGAGRRIGVGMVMPATTDIVRDVLKREWEYRLLSAVAHAHPFSLRQLSFKLATPHAGEQEEGSLFIEHELTPEAVVFVCQVAASAFLLAVQAKTTLYGWGWEQLSDQTAPLQAALRLSPRPH